MPRGDGTGPPGGGGPGTGRGLGRGRGRGRMGEHKPVLAPVGIVFVLIAVLQHRTK